MGDGVGAGFLGDLDQPLGDQRPGNGGAEQVDAFIDGVGAEHREDEIADELLAHILDIDVLDAEHLGLLAGRLQLAALSQIGGEGDNLRAILGLQPLEDDGGIEPARIGEDDFLDLLLGHGGVSCCFLRRLSRRGLNLQARPLSRHAARGGNPDAWPPHPGLPLQNRKLVTKVMSAAVMAVPVT